LRITRFISEVAAAAAGKSSGRAARLKQGKAAAEVEELNWLTKLNQEK
jgi:hypothetical protein